MSWRNTSDCRLSPPSHFFFVRNRKKNCADKKSACEWRDKTCQTYFQSRRGNSFTVFRHSDSCTFSGFWKFPTNAILYATNAISHAISHATNAISHATNLTLKKHIRKNSSFAPILKLMWRMQQIAARARGQSPHHSFPIFRLDNRNKADQVIRSAMTLNLLKSDGV